jgi:hypothetical protein
VWLIATAIFAVLVILGIAGFCLWVAIQAVGKGGEL